jgi:hypothetical protein
VTSGLIERTVVVAVIAVRMMQVPVDEIVDVVAVRHRLVPAAGAVLVARLMPLAPVLGRAAVGVLGRDLDDVLVDVVAVRMVQVSVVQVVDVIAVADGGVPAAWAMLVGMIGVMRLRARCHAAPLSTC